MKLALVHLLSEIEKHGGKDGLATRRLRQAVGTNACYDEIKEAEKQGYIVREDRHKPKGQKGNIMVVNILTAQGKQVLQSARSLGLV